MSKTEKNLAEAFAGESQANRKYLAFAKKADEEGLAQVARLFRAAALAETVHAHAHLRALGGISGTAENPRPIERVPAGTTFQLELGYRQFEMEAWEEDKEGRKVPQQISSDQSMLAYVKKALRLLELDTLGGSGSRGYGKVAFDNLHIVHQDGTFDRVNLQEVEL